MLSHSVSISPFHSGSRASHRGRIDEIAACPLKSGKYFPGKIPENRHYIWIAICYAGCHSCRPFSNRKICTLPSLGRRSCDPCPIRIAFQLHVLLGVYFPLHKLVRYRATSAALYRCDIRLYYVQRPRPYSTFHQHAHPSLLFACADLPLLDCCNCTSLKDPMI